MAAGSRTRSPTRWRAWTACFSSSQRKPEKLGPRRSQTLREQAARISQIIQQMKTFAHPIECSSTDAAAQRRRRRRIEMVRFDKRMKSVADDAAFARPMSACSRLAAGAAAGAGEPDHQMRWTRWRTCAEPKRDHPDRRAATGVCAIEVTDNGHGIRAGAHGQALRAVLHDQASRKGHRLGLSISYSLMQAPAGQIAVRSEVGKGRRTAPPRWSIRTRSASREREPSSNTARCAAEKSAA